MPYKETLIIMIRNPLKGLVKSRLATEAGIEKAYRVYKQLLVRLHINTISLPYRKLLFYDRYIDTDDQWNSTNFEKHLQSEGDIGDRMKCAIELVFKKGADKVILIGSDTPELDEVILSSAYRLLDHHDVVLGPANDGGYYLIGMNRSIPSLFNNKVWGENQVLRDTLQEIKQMNISFKLLPELIDIDTLDDLNESGFDDRFQDKLA